MEYKDKLDGFSGFQILEPFDLHDIQALQSPGQLMTIRTSSVLVNSRGQEELPEPEDRNFLLNQALRIQREHFHEALGITVEAGSPYDEADRSYIDNIEFNNRCACGQWEDSKHDQGLCDELCGAMIRRYHD